MTEQEFRTVLTEEGVKAEAIDSIVAVKPDHIEWDDVDEEQARRTAKTYLDRFPIDRA